MVINKKLESCLFIIIIYEDGLGNFERYDGWVFVWVYFF